MDISERPYPLRIVVDTLHYCMWGNPVVENIPVLEIRQRIEAVFGKELTQQAVDFTLGRK